MNRQRARHVVRSGGRLVAAGALAAAIAACSSGVIGPGTGGCGNAGSAVASPACSSPPTAPPGAAGQEAAVARARTAAGDSGATATVVWATVQPGGGQDTSGHEWLWVVRLEGRGLKQSPCPSGSLDDTRSISAPLCLDGEGGLDVVMDALTTEVLGTWH